MNRSGTIKLDFTEAECCVTRISHATFSLTNAGIAYSVHVGGESMRLTYDRFDRPNQIIDFLCVFFSVFCSRGDSVGKYKEANLSNIKLVRNRSFRRLLA